MYCLYRQGQRISQAGNRYESKWQAAPPATYLHAGFAWLIFQLCMHSKLVPVDFQQTTLCYISEEGTSTMGHVVGQEL
jgi:hypothetical protein